MKSCYFRKLDNPPRLAIIDCCDYYGQGYIITRLNVPEEMRNQGIAKALLSEICSDADSSSTKLWLEFGPYPGTDPARLEKLYREFGFRPYKGFFRRLPSK